MKVHAVLDPQAKQLIRGQSVDSLDKAARSLLDKLHASGLTEINMARALRHGIVSGELNEGGLAALRALPEVASVEVDGVMRAI
jgi:hypothetical protein